MEGEQNSPSALIVDDDAALLRIHARALTNRGYRVETAPDGRAATQALEKGGFDVILSDIDMPTMNGIELLQRVRAHDPDVPVILITGAPSLETAVKAVELGAMRYLVKPVSLQVLLKVTDDAVQLHRVARARRQRGLILGNNVDGRYNLRRDLGRGAEGLVFEAVHAFTGRPVALKVVSPDVRKSHLPELRARLLREARALARVRHPGVVEVLDGGVLDDGTPYLVMERLDGRSLEGLLTTRGKLSSDETVAMALQVCDALEAVHAAGVVHRDLKPANLLIVRDREGKERVKLVDFGIAWVNERGDDKPEKVTSVGELIGTAAYMAPEQLCALPDVDARADVYALGTTMFECLEGRVPYAGPYPRILLEVSAEGPPPALSPPVNAQLAAVVARALAKKREDRFATAAEMGRALREAVPDAWKHTTLLGPPPLPGPAETSATQRRRLPRAPYSTPVHILLPEGTIDGRTEDISEGGMLILSRQSCEVNARVSVRFALPIEGRVVSCEADLRWLRAARPEDPDGPCALGLEFVDPPAALRSSLRRYVELMGEGAEYYVVDAS
jgi:serine/threonine-protein kinase